MNCQTCHDGSTPVEGEFRQMICDCSIEHCNNSNDSPFSIIILGVQCLSSTKCAICERSRRVRIDPLTPGEQSCWPKACPAQFGIGDVNQYSCKRCDVDGCKTKTLEKQFLTNFTFR